jgi:glucan phosphoethanolaminetransferase (alkaline phosphatase superfamily)
MIRVILCPVQTSAAFAFISASTFDIVCTHMVHTMHNTQWEMHRSVMRTGDLLAMTPAGVQATAAAVAVAAARAERNNIRGFWTWQGRQSISGLSCAIASL